MINLSRIYQKNMLNPMMPKVNLQDPDQLTAWPWQDFVFVGIVEQWELSM